MPGVTLTVDDSRIGKATDAIDQMGGALSGDEVKRAMGAALRLTIINHFARLEGDIGRHKTAARLGATSTGFYADCARGTQLPEVRPDGVAVAITKEGIAQRYFGGTIKPGASKKWLTIPAIAEAYSKRARSFSNLRFVPLGPDLAALVERRATLLKRSRKGFTPAAETIGPVWYWLKRQVTQPADPNVLPMPKEMIDAAAKEGNDTISRIWQRMRDASSK